MYYAYLTSTPTKIAAFGNVIEPIGLGPIYSGSTYTTKSGPVPPDAQQQGTMSDPGNSSSSSVAPAGSSTTTPVSSVPVAGSTASPVVAPVTGAAGLNTTKTI